MIRRIATLAAATIMAALAVTAPSVGAATFGPTGPVWVNGTLNYDSTNGQTMLAAINTYEQTLVTVEQAAIPHNDAPINYIMVGPWVTATPAGVINFKLTLGYRNPDGTVTKFNQYEGDASLTVGVWPVSSLGLPLFHAEAVVANSWSHWHV